MKIVFLSLMFNDRQLSDSFVYSKAGVQMATHLFQKRLIDGLLNNGAVLKNLNIPPIGSFPFNYKKLIINYDLEDKEVWFINLPAIKRLQQERFIYTSLKRLVVADDFDCIIIYSLFLPFLKACKRIKIEHPSIKIGLIQTDAVPGRNDMYYSKSAERLGRKLVSYAKGLDFFILLSPYLRESLEINSRPCFLMECICESEQIINNVKRNNDRIFLYSGTTNREFGILNLAHAIAEIPNCSLWICGKGNCDKEIQEISKNHQNIRYFGYVDQNQLEKLRDQSDYLINPRTPSGTYTKYSFPSKTAEYLCSGKPVIMYKLEALPEEYYPYINFLYSTTVDGIVSEIKKIISLDYSLLIEKALKGRLFMMENKTGNVQAKKLISFLNIINKG